MQSNFKKETINIVYSKEELDKFRESPWGTTQRQQKEGLEFSKKEYDEIDKYCRKKNNLVCISMGYKKFGIS